MRFNLNDTVKITITEEGEKILLRQRAELEAVTGHKISHPVRKAGVHEMQLHYVMSIFGPYISLGAALPIGVEIDIPVSSGGLKKERPLTE